MNNVIRSAFRWLCGFLLVSSLALPQLLAAEDTGGFKALADTPQGSKIADLYSAEDLPATVNKFVLFSLVIACFLTVIVFCFGALQYARRNMWGDKQAGKEKMQNAALGLAFFFAMWVLLPQMNPHIFDLNALKVIQNNPIQG